MDAINDFGINFILFLQSLGGWLIAVMKGFSFLGTEQFFLFIAPAVYWCWDAGLGLRLGLLLMISSGVNLVTKLALHQPRPYWVDGRVLAHGAESSFGIPSGHAQNAVAVWAGMASWIRRGWFWALAGGLIFLIGLSRLFLGVHFPSDVLAGWAVGSLVLTIFLVSEKPALDWLQRRRLSGQILAIWAASLLIIGLGYLARLSLGNWTLPGGWVQMAAQATPEAEPIDPLTLQGIVSNAGVFFGLALGALFLWRSGGFNTRGSWGMLLARFVVGIIGVVVIWYGLDLIFPPGESGLALILRYLRYGLVGFWIAYLAPRLFVQVKLANK